MKNISLKIVFSTLFSALYNRKPYFKAANQLEGHSRNNRQTELQVVKEGIKKYETGSNKKAQSAQKCMGVDVCAGMGNPAVRSK
ncbi:MAG TPA: hypothetical protein VF721_23300 [Pyrinomonadaceae bacterium]